MTNSVEMMKRAEQEANVLLEKAIALSQAKNSGTDSDLITALDDNLQLWVGIETALKNAKNFLPQDFNNNLLKLSKFVERLTLSKGLKVTDSDVSCMVNINMQICKGLLESVHNSLAREEAFSLLKCAIDLSNARENDNLIELIDALDNNMKLWVYIKTLAQKEENILPQPVRNNLVKLADYVSAKTIEVGQDVTKINDKAIESMIQTNLQISEGLMSKEVA
jgi:flagellar biosynthesis regulator FlaF